MTILRRLSSVLGLVSLLGSGLLLGRELLAPMFDDEPASAAFTQSPCSDCLVEIRSAEVQARQGSTLFAFGGNWPTTSAQIPSDLRLEANGSAVILHPADAGFEVAQADGLQAKDVAVAIRPGFFLVAIASSAMSSPIKFTFGAWDGSEYSSRVPTEGQLR